MAWSHAVGLNIPLASGVETGTTGLGGPAPSHVTSEAMIGSPFGKEFRVELMVPEGARVAQGQPVARARKSPDFVLTAPMPGTFVRATLAPGNRLSSLLFYHDNTAGRHRFAIPADANGTTLWTLLAQTGLWRAFRKRPGVPLTFSAPRPSAILVMAHDTRPGSGRPLDWVKGRGGEIESGLNAIGSLTEGPVFVVHPTDDPVDIRSATTRVTPLPAANVHPWGLAGPHILSRCPPSHARAVWDIHIEDVADIGHLLRTGYIPETKHVAVSGPALRTPFVRRVQHGADIRALTYGQVVPGKLTYHSGSAIDGETSRWIRHSDRQVTVLLDSATPPKRSWLTRALRSSSSRPRPLIPTAGLDQTLGGVVPVMPLLRAIATGDTEAAIDLGVLALIEEDLALADYLTRSEPKLAHMLRTLLDRIAAEEAQ